MSAEKVLRQVDDLERCSTAPSMSAAGIFVVARVLDNLEAFLELKRAAAEWAVALHDIHQKVFTGPGPHPELEAFQERERRLAELALVVLEGMD